MKDVSTHISDYTVRTTVWQSILMWRLSRRLRNAYSQNPSQITSLH
jgi:hypothetical protein